MDVYVSAIVSEFTYLGVRFTHTGNMSSAIKALSDQALRAYCNLLSIFERVKLNVKTKLYLFDAMIVPILLYGSEVWGVFNLKEVDKLHMRFCKYVLGIKRQTPNAAVYGELGRLPLAVLCRERCLKCWLKIRKHVNSPMYSLYLDQCNNVNRTCWALKINSNIDHWFSLHKATF